MTDSCRNMDDRFRALLDFDWVPGPAPPKDVRTFYSFMQVPNETIVERKLRMLLPLSAACTACSMCELGLKPAQRNDVVRDPHVFSNMNPSKIMVVGQNPGWDELAAGEPFVGAAGKNFDAEVAKHGLTRKAFYICNTVRCFTAGNSRPTPKHVQQCEPFLRMEINLLKPKLVVALGSVAFSQLCPEVYFSRAMQKITKSEKFGVPVYAVYHPSPMNFTDQQRKKAFEEQIRVLCALVKKLVA